MSTTSAEYSVERDIATERADIDRLVGGHTVCSTFLATVRRQPSDTALRWRAGEEWERVSWSQYADRACRVAAGLRGHGVRPGDRVAMLLRNRAEFHLTDTGAMLAQATPVSIYNSSPPAQVEYFLRHSGAPVVVVEDADFAERVLAVRDRLPDLCHVVVVEPVELPGTTAFAELLAADPVDLDAAVGEVRSSDVATVIYTSGTTGTPKGVMLSHRNLTFAVESFARAMNMDLSGVRAISYLPMAHIGERICTHYLHMRFGTEVTTCADITQIVPYMIDVRPGWWFCAPRMWEKLHTAVAAILAADPEAPASFATAQEVGGRFFELSNEGLPVPPDLAAEWGAARADVIAPVLAQVGLDRVRIAITGSAPMPRQTFDFFTRCGLPLSDCYGQSESSGFVAWDPQHVVPGTSGLRFPGTELRIATDGEICSRGPHVFAGYLNAPELTADTIDADGWLHTGDLGRLDNRGNLHIVGRKKEMLLPTSGHNVSPVALEAALKESPLIAQACVVGDGRAHITALLVPDIGAVGAAELSGDALTAAAARHVEAVNERFPRAEHVRAFRLLDEEWLPDTDVMTPTAKLKRAGIQARYAELIEQMYQ